MKSTFTVENGLEAAAFVQQRDKRSLACEHTNGALIFGSAREIDDRPAVRGDIQKLIDKGAVDPSDPKT